MANINAPFGLRPLRTRSGERYNGAANPYFVPAEYAQELFVGDVVSKTGGSNALEVSAPGAGTFGPGALPTINRTTPGDGSAITGVIVAFAADPDALENITRPAGSQVIAFVADDPDLIFAVQSNGALATSDVGLTAPVATDQAGSLGTKRSGMELNAAAIGTSSTNQLLIRRILNRTGNEVGSSYVQAEVVIHNHTEAPGVVGFGGSGGALPTPTDGPSDIALTDFSRDLTIYDSGIHRGLNDGQVRVRVTPSQSGSPIYARARAENGSIVTDWTQVGTSSGTGLQDFTFSVPRSTEWMFLDVAYGDGLIRSSANKFGVGHVWAYWGQSNYARLDLYDSSQAWLRETVVAPSDFQVVRRQGTFSTIDDAEATPITDATFVSPAMIAMANAFAANRPGEKFMVGWHSKGGTSTADTMTTEAEGIADTYGVPAEGARDWNGDYVTHRGLVRDGSRVGVAWVGGWYAANGGGGPLLTDLFAPLFLGKDGDGNAIDPRTPGVVRTLGLPRAFCAVTQDGRDFGEYDYASESDGGIYDMRYTKMGYLGPHGRSRVNMPDAATVSDFASLDGYNSGDDNDVQELFEDADKICNGNPSAFPEVIQWLGSTAGAERQREDELHFHATSPDGRPRFAKIISFYSLKQLGMISTPIPRLDLRYDELDGSAAYFGIAGRNLTTERLARVAAGETLSNRSDGSELPPNIIPELPNLSPDHRTEVMGFSINNIAAQSADIYTVQGSDTELLAAGFTTGQAVARVLPNSGTFSANDVIIYGVDRLPGYQVGGETGDYANSVRAFLNWLAVDMGQADLPRMPVQHQSLILAQPTTLPLPPAFTIDGTTSWESGVGVVDTDFQMAYEVKGFVSNLAQDRFIQLGSSTAAMLRLQGTGALNYRDGGSSIAYNTNSVALGVPFHFRLIIDRNKVSDQLTLIDVINGVTETGTGTTGTDFPNNSLNFAPDGLTGSFEKLAVWVGDNSVDWQPDWSSDPDYGIVGNAGGLPTIFGALTQTGPNPT